MEMNAVLVNKKQNNKLICVKSHLMGFGLSEIERLFFFLAINIHFKNDRKFEKYIFGKEWSQVIPVLKLPFVNWFSFIFYLCFPMNLLHLQAPFPTPDLVNYWSWCVIGERAIGMVLMFLWGPEGMLTVSYTQKEQALPVISSGFSSLPSTCTCSAFAGVCVYVCVYFYYWNQFWGDLLWA